MGLAAGIRRFGLFALAALVAAHPQAGRAARLQAGKPARAEPAPQRLEAGRPAEHEIAGGQSHSYQIRLEAGQFLKVVVEQIRIDLVVALYAPDGSKLEEIDSPTETRGDEFALAVAETSGEYRLEVRSNRPDEGTGRYKARVAERRPATGTDLAVFEAVQLVWGGAPKVTQGEQGNGDTPDERALELLERALGPEHPDLAPFLLRFAGMQEGRRDFARGAALTERALEIDERALGPDHPVVAGDLYVLAFFCRNTYDYPRAEAFFTRALAIQERAFGHEDPAVARTLNEFSGVYDDQGDYARALPLLERAVAIQQKVLPFAHWELARSFLGLATIHYALGNLAKAESAALRAREIAVALVGPDHPRFIIAKEWLARVARDRGEYEKAERLLLDILAVRERAFGPNHFLVGGALCSLASFYRERGELEKAERLMLRALPINEAAHGRDHPITVHLGHYPLSLIYWQRGDYARAEKTMERARAILEPVVGTRNVDVLNALDALAALAEARGDASEAVVRQARLNEARESALLVNLAIGSERRKLDYLRGSAADLDRTLSLHTRTAPEDPRARRMALEIVLRRKGRALDVMAESMGALARRATPEDRRALEALSNARSRLAALTLHGPGDAGVARHRADLAALGEEADRLEAEVAKRSAEFRARSQPVSLEAVRAGIPEGATLVELAAFKPVDVRSPGDKPSGPARYVAYTLAADGAVGWASLGDASAVDAAVDRLREALRDPSRADVRRLAREVDELVMRPVRPLLGGSRRLLISPDGALNLLPFEALVDEDGRYAVDRFAITYLTSGRDLLRLQVRGKRRQGPLVVADPAFSATTGQPSSARGATTVEPVDMARLVFTRLFASAAEAREVARLLPGARVLTGGLATEAAVKAAAGPDVLHVATHGFFYPAATAGQPSPTRLAGEPRAEGDRIENPLLRSGLALAGANLHRSGDDDGLLTALEVAGLDLWGTELAVLSACDTGIGETSYSDGVYGLRRALVLAGAETQMMTLWPVDDRTTRDLMVAYYTRLRGGAGRGDALRAVQLAALADPKRRHPYYWAGFIVSGQWVPLEGR